MRTDLEPALRVTDLDAAYGRNQVTFGMSLEVRRGEIVALLGRNGAGKTTTLMAIGGLVRVRGGSVALDGRRLDGEASFRRVRAGLSLVPSGSRAFRNLTVAENLSVVRRGPDARWTVEHVFELFPALRALRSSRGRQLSGGERQMLAVARALLSQPKVLMLDEPSEGLAPMVVRDLAAMLRRISATGLGVLLAEQNHRLALEIADRASFIEKGRVAWQGNANEAQSQEVIERYLSV